MSIKERKERARLEMREHILTAAKEIITNEGIESLSIRKIASGIEYSPAIIYHYFKDKEAIVDTIMAEGYKKIVDSLKALQSIEGGPAERLKSSLRKYIEMALLMSEEYKSVMLNSSSSILQHTSVLFKGASEERQAIKILYKYLKDNYLRSSEEYFIELTAQIIWSSIFGLIIRIIIEKDLKQEQKDILIEHNLDFLINGLKHIGNNSEV